MRKKSKLLLIVFLLLLTTGAKSQTTLPKLHVEGCDLVDTHGNKVVLHGVMDTPSPYFNGGRWGSAANDNTVSACIDYFDKLFTAITDKSQGAYCNIFRLHLDPCWTNDATKTSTGVESGEADISRFSLDSLKHYFTPLYWKIIDKALSHGLYVVVRPPGVCPDTITVDGYYQAYLKKVWGYVAANVNMRKYSGNVSIELANEPVTILNSDSTEATASAPHDFFQPIVDLIRSKGFTGVIWVPGTGYQSWYAGYESYPIEGYNIGYAVHDYPGWYNCSDKSCDSDAYIKQFGVSVPVVKTNPILISEVDWSPVDPNGTGHYDEHNNWIDPNYGTWGTASTSKWGKAYKALLDHYGNISMTLTGTDDYIDIDKYLADGTVTPAFDGMEEACGKACFDWYEEYAKVDYPRADFTNVTSCISSNGQRFYNPVITADFPDPDVAKLGDTYYMASTTMHNFPGATILKSKDLINWEYCAQPLTQLADDDKFNLQNGQNAYAGGMWACALTAHDGKLYLLINGNSAGGFILSTSDPEGQWTTKKLDRIYYDPGMLFDNGKVYIVCGINTLTMNTLDEDFNWESSTNVVVRDNAGLEGSHLYKIGDYYYIYSTYGGWPTGQTIFRSKDINGTYEEKMLLEKTINGEANTIHQGALIETDEGEWWTMLMQDLGPIGRLPSLHPVKWADGWSAIGNNGVPSKSYALPKVSEYQMSTPLPTNDNFRSYPLGNQWEWNHNADDNKWTLFDRPGYLRLYTATVTDDLMKARNTLTQRIFGRNKTTSGLDGTVPSIGTVALHLNGMKEGDKAGIAVIQDPHAYIAVYMKDGKKSLVWHRGILSSTATEATVTETSAAIDSVIYLRAKFDYSNSECTFYYSTDNSTFTQLGETTTLTYNLSVFVGARFGIFNFANTSLGGYVDADWFSTEDTFDESTYYDPNYDGLDENLFTAVSMTSNVSDVSMMVGKSQALVLTATYADGHTADVTSKATYTYSGGNNIVDISDGKIFAKSNGTVNVTATYKDPVNNKFEVNFNVNSTLFPWESQYISRITNSGTYVENTKVMRPGKDGQIGWVYDNGADMSGYKYLVVKLDKEQSYGASINIYGQNDINGDCYSTSIGTQTTVVIPLQSIKYTSGTNIGSSVAIDNVYIVSIKTASSGTIDLSDVYLTNNDDYSPTGISAVVVDNSSNSDNAIYNLQGIRVSKPTKGVYIQNGRKMVVR